MNTKNILEKKFHVHGLKFELLNLIY